jgi:hypothetical protein
MKKYLHSPYGQEPFFALRQMHLFQQIQRKVPGGEGARPGETAKARLGRAFARRGGGPAPDSYGRG